MKEKGKTKEKIPPKTPSGIRRIVHMSDKVKTRQSIKI